MWVHFSSCYSQMPETMTSRCLSEWQRQRPPTAITYC